MNECGLEIGSCANIGGSELHTCSQGSSRQRRKGHRFSKLMCVCFVQSIFEFNDVNSWQVPSSRVAVPYDDAMTKAHMSGAK